MSSDHRQGRWRQLYHTARWLRIRQAQLVAEPFCRLCASKGIRTLASVVDHLERHNGNPIQFYLGAKQSLCLSCHNRDKQQIELHGYSDEVDADGWPIDPNHPSYARQPKPVQELEQGNDLAEDWDQGEDAAEKESPAVPTRTVGIW